MVWKICKVLISEESWGKLFSFPTIPWGLLGPLYRLKYPCSEIQRMWTQKPGHTGLNHKPQTFTSELICDYSRWARKHHQWRIGVSLFPPCLLYITITSNVSSLCPVPVAPTTTCTSQKGVGGLAPAPILSGFYGLLASSSGGYKNTEEWPPRSPETGLGKLEGVPWAVHSRAAVHFLPSQQGGICCPKSP